MTSLTLSPRTRLLRRERGQSVVEFGIIVVIFFMLVSGIVDFGRTLNAWIVVSSAAREGARYAAIGANDADVLTRVQAYAPFGVDPLDMEMDPLAMPRPAAGGQITVTVRLDFEILTPLVRGVFGCGGSGTCTVPISSATTMRYEGVYIP